MARPVGSKNKLGLTLEKRLKILSKIALDKSAKAPDVIAAVKEITQMLNDRVKEVGMGAEPTVIKFDEATVTTTITTPVITVENTEITTTTTTKAANLSGANICHNVMTSVIPKENVINDQADELRIDLLIDNEHPDVNS
jgi:hypothetical protein